MQPEQMVSGPAEPAPNDLAANDPSQPGQHSHALPHSLAQKAPAVSAATASLHQQHDLQAHQPGQTTHAAAYQQQLQPESAWQQHARTSATQQQPPSSPPDHLQASQDMYFDQQQQQQDKRALSSSPSLQAPGSVPRDSPVHATEFQLPHSNGQLDEDARAGSTRRRHSSIKSKSWAGSVVWAKLGDFPWWPAQVLDDKDSYIPAGAEPPRRGAVPVRFFGTYEFSYIQSQRALAPFDDPLDGRRSQCEDAEFFLGVKEADEFTASSSLPEGFFQQHEPTPPPVGPKQRRVTKSKSKKSQKNDALAQAKARILDDLAPPLTARRKERILQSLALKPPPGSPFADSLCLAGIEGLLAYQNSKPHAEPFRDPAEAVIPGHVPLPQAIAAQAQVHAPGLLQAPQPSGDAMMQSAGGIHQPAGQGLGQGMQLHGGLSGFGPLLQFPNMQLHAPHVSLMPNQADRSRLQFGGLPMQ